MRILTCILFLTLPVAAAAPIDIKSVGYPNGMRSAEISPDGKHIAAIVVDGGQNVAVLIDTDTLESKPFFNRKQVNATALSLWDQH